MGTSLISKLRIMTIINVTKEVIEEQHLNNGFSVQVMEDGAIFIKPIQENKVRENWATQIDKDIKLNGLPNVEFKDNLGEIKDWTW
jgi:hypothetical protein